MTQDDIEKAAGDYSGSSLGFTDNNSVMEKHKAFSDGANWRINSVWHDTDDRSIKIDNDKEVVLLLENGKLIEYDDDWEQYCCIAVKWAYIEDLLPNMEE